MDRQPYLTLMQTSSAEFLHLLTGFGNKTWGQTDPPPPYTLILWILFFLLPLNMGDRVPKDIRWTLGAEVVNLRVTWI
jgi:hypothetical protein